VYRSSQQNATPQVDRTDGATVFLASASRWTPICAVAHWQQSKRQEKSFLPGSLSAQGRRVSQVPLSRSASSIDGRVKALPTPIVKAGLEFYKGKAMAISSKSGRGYIENSLTVKRVANVVKGRPIFAFRASCSPAMAKGRVGFGSWVGAEVPAAYQKAWKLHCRT